MYMKAYPILKGNSFYLSIERLILNASADDEIIANYFVIREDTMGLKFCSLLLDAAKRGVRIKLIIDSYGSCHAAGNGTEYIGDPLSEDLLTTLRLNGIELYIYRPIISNKILHPFNLFQWKNYSRRNHNKIFVFNLKRLKKRGVIVGDTQWANEHFNSQFIGHNLLIFSTDLYIQAKQYNTNLLHTDECKQYLNNHVSSKAMSFWEKRLSFPLKKVPFQFNFLNEFQIGKADFVYSEIQFDCMESRKTIQDIEINLLKKMQTKGVYCTPYFCPDLKMLKALLSFLKKGGKVFIGKYSDDPYLPYGVHQAIKYLSKKCFSVFSYEGYGNVHYKDLICDDQVFIKSANGEGRSRFYNLDSGILVQDHELAKYFIMEHKKSEVYFSEIMTVEQVEIKHTFFERVIKFLFRPFYYHHL